MVKAANAVCAFLVFGYSAELSCGSEEVGRRAGVEKTRASIHDNDTCHTHETEDIVEWVRANGGLVHKNLRIQTGAYGRGFFANGPISKGEIIVSVPLKLMMADSKEHPCHTVVRLRDEMRLGNCSFYWPYLKFMEAVAIDNPDVWNTEEMAVLEGLPPGDWNLHTGRLRDDCKGITDLSLDDPVDVRALFLYVTRSGPEGMQPIFDIFNHGYNSTWHFVTDDKSAHAFQTKSPITTGSEIFNQFRPGAGHGRRITEEMTKAGSEPDGAPEIFRDYGFVERAPTFWWFEYEEGVRHRWVIEDYESGAVWWPSTIKPDFPTLVDHAGKLLEKLTSQEALLKKLGPNVSLRRHELGWEYRQAFESALRAVISEGKKRLSKASKKKKNAEL